MTRHRKKEKILIVDDVPDNIRILIEILKDEYATIPATSGKMALEKLADAEIDLILLDILMPDMDGYETCHAIRSTQDIDDIPIIFITAISEAMDDAKGFSAGGNDYISKPFTPSTVRARVKNQLKLRRVIRELEELYQIALDSNPLTGLPGNNTIRSRIEDLLKEHAGMVVLYADLDHFKPFNDQYGFARGDAVLTFTADIFKEVMNRITSKHTFIGHIGGDDFVLLIPLEFLDQAVDEIILRFDEGIRGFYDGADLDKGYLVTADRQGELQKFPTISISLAGVNLTQTDFDHYLSVVDTCTEMKKVAKKKPGSVFVYDRRTG